MLSGSVNSGTPGSGVSPTTGGFPTGDFSHWVSPTTGISYGVPIGTVVRLGGSGCIVTTGNNTTDNTTRGGMDRLRAMDRVNVTSPDDWTAIASDIVPSCRKRGFPPEGVSPTSNMSATIDTPTADDRTEQFDYYLLLPGTDLPRSVSRDLPASVSQQAPVGSGIDWKVDRGRSKFIIIRVDTEAMRVDAARGRDAVHPDPAGDSTFSSTSEIVFNRSDSFSDDIRKPSSTFVDADTVFALDTLCFELTNEVSYQFTFATVE